jgi:uncharacterized protein YbjT (DUF2867 family)
MPKKIIAVIGATGAQGGGLVRAIQEDQNGDFGARAVTRHVDSDKAKELAKLGAEIVQADNDDVETLKRAFSGAHGAFCVTNYWEYFSPEREKAQAKNMIEAAKHAGLAHVIWSTLEDTRKWVPLNDDRMPTLMDHYKVPHFDGKGESDKYFTEAGLPVTFSRAAFYWENFIFFGMGPKVQGGVLALTLPLDGFKLPGIGAVDIGKCAYGVFKKGREYIGKTVGLAGEQLTGAQMATAMSKALGKEVRYNGVTPETYRGFGFPGAEDLGNMFQFQSDFQKEFLASRDPVLSKSLNPELQTFDAWLMQNASRMPLD